MDLFEHQIYQLKQAFGDELTWVHALFYPEINRLASAGIAQPQFDRRLIEISESTPIENFGLRVAASPPQIKQLTLKLAPAAGVQRKGHWIEPIELDVAYAVWQRDENLVAAFVPMLNLSVIQPGKIDAKFVGELRIEIRSSLIRSGMLDDLTSLPKLAEFSELTLNRHPAQIRLPTAKKVAQESLEHDQDESDELKAVATRIDIEARPATRTGKTSAKSSIQERELPATPLGFYLDTPVKKLAELMAEPDRDSVLLVGPEGVGKTQLTLELGRRKHQLGLAKKQFWQTSGSRIVAGMTGFGQWQQRCQNILERLKKCHGILLVGNLLELLEVGQSNHQSQTVASWMQIQVQRGQLQIVAECTPQQLSIIEQREPQLLASLTSMPLERPDPSLQKKILTAVLQHSVKPSAAKVDLTEAAGAIDTICRLHQRYATYSANPGQPIQFLRRAIEDATIATEDATPVTERIDRAAPDRSNPTRIKIDEPHIIRSFAKQSGLPPFLLDRDKALDFDQMNAWFSSRIIGQPHAVNTVIDLIATIKAELTPVGKPIASLMFIGPTGVGKTQLAKSLAEFMFSSDQRLLRFDMSEFGDPWSVQRLIGGGGQTEGVLTGKIRQHPFSVVLFDEFEKAHASFFDLLLQILGEGRLTDAVGRTTDFSTTIVVITSNLGAEQFRPTAFGFSDPEEVQADADRRYEDHFVEQIQRQLRPELFNRIDRIVAFRPLQLETIKKIIQREIDQLKRREGIWHRGVELEVSDDCQDFLASSSLDLRYGARPIQRMIQDSIAAPLATRLAAFSDQQRLFAKVWWDDSSHQIRFDVKGTPPKQQNKKSMVAVIGETQQLRRRAHQLMAGNAMIRIRNEMYQRMQALDRNQRRLRKLAKSTSGGASGEANSLESANRILEAEISQFEHVIDASQTMFDRCCGFEQEQLTAYYAQANLNTTEIARRCQQLNQQLKQTIFKNFLFESQSGDKVTLLVWTRNVETRQSLITGYLDFAERQNLRIKGFWIVPYDPKNRKQDSRYLHTAEDQPPVCELISPDTSVQQGNRGRLLSPSKHRVLAIGLTITGPAAYPLFSYESGRHQFKNVNTREAVVEVIGGDVNQHMVKPTLLTLSPFDEFPVQRTYHFVRQQIEDAIFKKIPLPEATDIPAAICLSLERCLQHHLDKYIE